MLKPTRTVLVKLTGQRAALLLLMMMMVLGLTAMESSCGANATAPSTSTSGAAIGSWNLHSACKTQTSPFFILTCAGTLEVALNRTVQSGSVVATINYGTTGSEWHGVTTVSQRSGVAGTVTIPMTLSTTHCIGGSYSATLALWDGAVLADNTPLLGSSNGQLNENISCP